MFDIVRRRSYDTRRVLIDSARVLDPQFNDSLVCLSGAELELLRNLTQYLHRQDTFVATYCANHYLTPDQDAWDAIQAIVAGLEEKIMGCNNVVYGYMDVLGHAFGPVSTVDGQFTVLGAQVPADEVWRVLGINVMRGTNAPNWIHCVATIDSTDINLKILKPPVNWESEYLPIDLVLKEDDRIRCLFDGATIGESCLLHYWGYKMEVP